MCPKSVGDRTRAATTEKRNPRSRATEKPAKIKEEDWSSSSSEANRRSRGRLLGSTGRRLAQSGQERPRPLRLDLVAGDRRLGAYRHEQPDEHPEQLRQGAEREVLRRESGDDQSERGGQAGAANRSGRRVGAGPRSPSRPGQG